MANERFVRFTPHQDNANEVIDASHINTLQDTSEDEQRSIYVAQDQDFLDKALFILQNHRTLNGLWIDLFEDTSKIDLQKTVGLVFSQDEQAIVFPDNSPDTQGILYSSVYVNPNANNMKSVSVMITGIVPDGASVQIQVSNNLADWYDVPTGQGDPFQIPSDGQRLQLRATFTRTDLTTSPRLDAWALLFRDNQLDIIDLLDGTQVTVGTPGQDDNGGPVNIFHYQLKGITPDDHHPQLHAHDGTDGSGLISHDVLTNIGTDDHHPKNHQHGQDGVQPVNLATDVVGTLGIQNLSFYVWTGMPGTTGMFFDPDNGDKLTYVKTPDDETYLFYDPTSGSLDHTITIRAGVATWEQMTYGPYVDSTGATQIVLQGTNKSVYDATSLQVKTEIDKITAPAAPLGLTISDPGVGGTLNLQWTANTETDLAGYNVYFSTDGGTTWMPYNTTGVITDTHASITGLINGATYSFHITAVDTTGYESTDSIIVTGTPSLVDTIAPAKPMGLTATNNSGTVSLSWTANTELDLASYNIYRSTTGAPGSFIKLGSQLTPATTYSDTGLAAGSYWYYITAVDGSGNESVPSDSASVTV